MVARVVALQCSGSTAGFVFSAVLLSCCSAFPGASGRGGGCKVGGGFTGDQPCEVYRHIHEQHILQRIYIHLAFAFCLHHRSVRQEKGRDTSDVFFFFPSRWFHQIRHLQSWRVHISRCISLAFSALSSLTRRSVGRSFTTGRFWMCFALKNSVEYKKLTMASYLSQI